MDKYKIKYVEYHRGNITNARKMREYPTQAERKFWEDILKHRPLGYKFTRQKPLEFFIVDFYCSRLKLAIELDGEGHKGKKQYDVERDMALHKKGIIVTRYRNNEVMGRPDKVYKNVTELIITRAEEIKRNSI